MLNRKPEEKGENKRLQEPIITVSNRILQLTPSNFQHIGAREVQEDAFLLSDFTDTQLLAECGALAVVADGMGGLVMGEEASRLAVQVFLREHFPLQTGESVSKRLSRAIMIANTAVYDYALNGGREFDLGTTLVATLIHKCELSWISVGDSRIYHFRNGSLTQLNREHIYKNQLMEEVHNGKMTKEEADNHPEGAYLTSYIGLPELPEVDRNEDPLELMPGDQVILCSDGLYNTLSDEEIRVFFLDADRINAEYLVNKVLAKNNRHQDNITVVIISCSSLGQ